MVRITADMAESTRRSKHDEAREKRIERLLSDQKSSQVQLDAITADWDQALRGEGVDELASGLQTQRAACDKLVRQKEEIIKICHLELKHWDDEFVKDLRSQAHDITTILDTMSGQAKTMWAAYRSQLDDIERVFVTERGELLKQRKKIFTDKMKIRADTEASQSENALQAIADREAEVERLLLTDSEEYNLVKRKLEADIHTLEQQLQQMRATYLLNTEKLEYNFQVLKKRQEENQTVISQQKTRITRLQGVYTSLQQKEQKVALQGAHENAALTDDYKRITDQFKELQRKTAHFKANDRETYDQVRNMNEDRVRNLLNDVLAADKAIMEQQLGLHWDPPCNTYLIKDKPQSNDKSVDVVQSAAAALKEIFTDDNATLLQPGSDSSNLPTKRNSATDVDTTEIDNNDMRSALELIACEADYLVEAKLTQLLTTLPETERLLMKLDSIFKALGINDRRAINLLAKHCFHESVDDDGKHVLIHPNEVPQMLRTFVERKGENRITEVVESDMSGTFSHDLKYWDTLGKVHTDERDRIWTALSSALEQYALILSERSKALDRTDELKQQNGELKSLLQQYMSSEVGFILVYICISRQF